MVLEKGKSELDHSWVSGLGSGMKCGQVQTWESGIPPHLVFGQTNFSEPQLLYLEDEEQLARVGINVHLLI